MKIEITKSKLSNGGLKATLWYGRLTVLAAAILVVSAWGCKKDADNLDRDYGYAKITIACKNKCHISFPVADGQTEYDAENETSISYVRYRRNFNLNINITPVDKDQEVTFNVYSREERQIFHNVSIRKVNEVWNSKIMIP